MYRSHFRIRQEKRETYHEDRIHASIPRHKVIVNNVYVWIREYPKLDLHRWSRQISLTTQLQSIEIPSDALQTCGSVRASRRPITFRAIVTGSWPCRFSIDVVNQPSNDRVNPLECASLRAPFNTFQWIWTMSLNEDMDERWAD